MDAVLQGQYPTAQLLVASGTDINKQNKNGNTAAHIAALNGNLTILQFLVANRANVLIKNFEDYTCFEHAQMMGNAEVSEYLEPVIMKAEIWRNKNCLVKIFLNKKRVKNFSQVPNGVFREIIKYA
jgi:ankyrin repeat protein